MAEVVMRALRPRTRRGRWLRNIAIAFLVLFALDRAFPPPVPDLQRDGGTMVLARDGTPLRGVRGGRWCVALSDDAR